MPNAHKSKTLDYLAGLLDICDTRTDIEKTIRWLPDRLILLALSNARLKQIERVAIVVVAYAKDHGGASPPWTVVGDVLGINKSTARDYGIRLAANREHIGEFRHASFYLRNAVYEHPLLTKVLRETKDED